jgi:hypothetical protein
MKKKKLTRGEPRLTLLLKPLLDVPYSNLALFHLRPREFGLDSISGELGNGFFILCSGYVYVAKSQRPKERVKRRAKKGLEKKLQKFQPKAPKFLNNKKKSKLFRSRQPTQFLIFRCPQEKRGAHLKTEPVGKISRISVESLVV